MIIKRVRSTFIVIEGINNEEKKQKKNWEKSFKEKKK